MRLRASASSMVRLRRRFWSSGSGPPPPNRGSNFWNWTRVVPKLLKLSVTAALKPDTKLTMAMTVATPATMPSRVRKLRSFCATMARKAKRTFSVPMPLKPECRWTMVTPPGSHR